MNNILSKYDTLLFDIDDTILDFQKAERQAMRIALETVGLKVTDEILDHYHQVNMKYCQIHHRAWFLQHPNSSKLSGLPL